MVCLATTVGLELCETRTPMLIVCKVLNYEVVLSNASIVNANATSNTDLFWALKGGGDQFGETRPSSIILRANAFSYCHEICSEDLPY
jgi:hypothetical protein